jgi:ankyrin repeat protein
LEASSAGQEEIVQLLIERGADLNISNRRGETALILAALLCRLGVADRPIRAGANATLKDHCGRTALTIAAAERLSCDFVRLLVDEDVIDHSADAALGEVLRKPVSARRDAVQDLLTGTRLDQLTLQGWPEPECGGERRLEPRGAQDYPKRGPKGQEEV